MKKRVNFRVLPQNIVFEHVPAYGDQDISAFLKLYFTIYKNMPVYIRIFKVVFCNLLKFAEEPKSSGIIKK